jgi:photosystem II stability/assembly factor-like uncharacterized protein
VSTTKAFIFSRDAATLKGIWLETGDGGLSWQNLHGPCRQGDFYNAAATLDGQTIWAACGGQPAAGTELKEVYVSADGGRTWELRAATPDLPPGPVGTLTEGGYVSDLALASRTTGFLALARGGILRSSDRGRTWRAVTLPGTEFGDLSPSLWVLDSEHSWAVTGSGEGSGYAWPGLFRSTDGGSTWTQVATSR